MSAQEALDAVAAANPSRLADVLIALPERERRAIATELQRRAHTPLNGRNMRDASPNEHFTSQVALFGTGISKDFEWAFPWIECFDRLVDVILARPPKVSAGIVRAILRSSRSDYWFVVRDLVRRGDIEHPNSEDYYTGLIVAVTSAGRINWHDVDPRVRAVCAHLSSDPALEEELFTAMSYESVANTVSTFQSDLWLHCLRAAVDAGLLDRQRMLNVALRGQLRDLRPSTSAFFRKTFEALSPSPDEQAARCADFVRILGASQPSEQRFAASVLVELTTRGVPVDASAVSAATSAALSGKHKGAAVAALELLSVLPLDEAARAKAAIVGLGHSHSDVQGAVLRVLETDAVLGADLREEMLLWADSVAPKHRGRFENLVGVRDFDHEVDTPDLDETSDRIAKLDSATIRSLGLMDADARVRAGRMPEPVIFEAVDAPPAAAIEPITGIDELIETLTVLLGGSGDPVDMERAIDGLARISPSAVSDVALSPVRRILDGGSAGGIWFMVGAKGHLAEAVSHWCDRSPPELPPFLKSNTKLIGRPSLTHDLRGLRAKAELPLFGAFDGSPYVAGSLGFLSARLWEAVVIGTTQSRPTLALPSTVDGRLTSADLIERLRVLDEQKAVPGRFETVQALLRVQDALPPLPRLAEVSKSIVASGLRALSGAAERIDDVGVARAAAPTSVSPSAIVTGRVPRRFRSEPDVLVVRYNVAPTHDGLRRDDLVGELVSELILTEDSQSHDWWNAYSSVVSESDQLLCEWLSLALPRHRHLVEARAAALIAEQIDANRSTSHLDVILNSAAGADRPLTWSTHFLLAAGLNTKQEAIAAAATDLFTETAQDCRLDAHLLGSLVGQLTTLGVAKPSRFSARLTSVASLSPLVAERVRVAMVSWLITTEGIHRESHAVFELLETACAKARRGIDEGAARERLTELTAGSSKRAATARRLLALDAGSEADLAIHALDQMLARAERWSDRVG